MNEAINGATHSWALTYDARGRLASVTLDGVLTTYGYDPNGNRTTVNDATVGTYDAQDRLVSLAAPGGSTWSYGYTNNGDLTCKTSGTEEYAFDYDVSSNLRSVQVNATSLTAGVTYTIDGMNRRIARSIVPTVGAAVADGLLYDEQNRVVAELDASGNVVSTFVYGLKPNVPDYMVRGGTVYRIVSDWRGDVRLVLDTTKTGSAAVVQQIDYDAWGNVVNLVDPDCGVGRAALCWQPFGFAGGLWETSTGVVKFGARDYDPASSRWVSKDPIGFAGGDSNVYAYVSDDPINRIDQNGLIAGVDDAAEAGGALLGAFAAAAAYGAVCLVNPQACQSLANACVAALTPATSPRPPCPTPPLPDIRVDFGHSHGPCQDGHVHISVFVYNQNPETCQCYLQKIESVVCL